MFVLPEGFRPPIRRIFTFSHYLNTDYGFGRLDISPAGEVVDTFGTPNGGYVSLDGVSFQAAP